MATHDFKHDSGIQTSNANKAIQGSEQIQSMRKQMTEFVDDFGRRSKGKLVEKTIAANAATEVILANLVVQLGQFAEFEKKFAATINTLDDETVV